jgi:predicted nucleic acid-binding protein
MGETFLDAFATRFAGYDRYFNEHPPRRSDAELRRDGYDYALAVNDPDKLAAEPLAEPATRDAVFWDIPDFSTEEAMIYMDAVLDTIALADLIVMTVTKENYADHRGGLLRYLVCSSGVPLRVVANKLEDEKQLLEDIRLKLTDSGDQVCRIQPDHLHPLPYISQASDADRLQRLLEMDQARAVREAVARDLAADNRLKRQALLGSLNFVERRLDDLLAPLRAEVAVAEYWHAVVDRTTRDEFYDRYRRDYLEGEQYVDFNQTLVKLLDMLEVPGIGPIIATVSRGLKTLSAMVVGAAANVLRGLFSRKGRGESRMPERDVVVACFEHWLESLRNEAQIQADRGDHPAWHAIARQLGDSSDFIVQSTENLGAAYLQYRQRMDKITDERARALYETIRENPRLVHSLRAVKLSADAGTAGLIIASHGLDWTDAVIAPLVLPAWRLLLEYVGEKYLDVQKAKLKQEQFDAFREMIEQHMVTPVRRLFVSAVSPEEMDAAHNDFKAVKAAAQKIVGRSGK